MSKEIMFQVLNGIFNFIGAGVTGGLIVLLFNNALAIRRDGRNRRIAFRGFVTSIKSEISSIQDKQFPDWFAELIPKMAGECDRVRRDVSCFRRQGFQAASIAFCDTKRHDIVDDIKQGVRLDEYGISIYPTCEKGRNRMRKILKELYDAA
jgi:hypothetical protein